MNREIPNQHLADRIAGKVDLYGNSLLKVKEEKKEEVTPEVKEEVKEEVKAIAKTKPKAKKK